MLTIVRQRGFGGTISELELKLANDPEQRFQLREEMLAYSRNAAKIIEPDLPNQFKHIPPFLLYEVRAIPVDREQAEASSARPPAPDGSASGWFFSERTSQKNK